MPISPDDQARLPPLTPYDEVAERQRLADMKAFRQYLVETDTVKCMVKLYAHIAKNEMRLDNPTILKEFLANHVQNMDEVQEAQRLAEENASLRDRKLQLESEAETLAQELQQQKRLAVGKTMWRYMVSTDFWEGELGDEALANGFPLALLYRRLCGQKVDKGTRKVLVNLFRPASHDEKELAGAASIPQDRFYEWISNEIPDFLHEWCEKELLPRFSSVTAPSEAPYERELLQAIQDTGLYPDNLDEVPYAVNVDRDLLNFLELAVNTFKV